MPADSTVNGTLAVNPAGGQTFQTGDVINANATSDVNVNVLADTANVVDINNARSVNFRNLSGGNITAGNMNAILWDGVGRVSSTNSLAGNVGIGNAALASTYALVTPLVDSGAGLNVTYRAADIAGAADTANLEINGAGAVSAGANANPAAITINNNSTGATATGVEFATLATFGTNDITLNGGTNLRGLTVTGAGTNGIAIAAGGVTNAAQTYNLAAATGANVLDVAGTLSASSTVTGGAGADTLRVTPAGLAATNLSVSGVETLRLRNAAAAGTLAFQAVPNFSTIRLDAGGNAGTAVQLLNSIASTSTVSFAGAATAATSGATQTFNGITATGSTAGAADTMNLVLGNGGVQVTNATPYTVGEIIANGIENLNISVADATANGQSTLTQGDGFNSDTLQTVTLTGASGVLLDLDAANNNGGNLVALNLAGLTTTTARSVVTLTRDNAIGAATTVTASAGGTGLVTQAEQVTNVITFTGGAGADIINDDGLTAGATSLFTGFVNFNGGAGADELFLTASAGVTANGGDGADVFVGSNNIDTLRGDADNDTLQGQGAADVITGGTGADDFVMAGLVSGAAIGLDNITDYSLAQGDQIGGYGVANLETLAILGNLETARGAANVAAGAVVTSAANVAAAVNFDTLAAGTNIVLLQGNYANAGAVAADIQANVTSDGTYAAGDGFMIAYDDGATTTVALVTTPGGIADNNLWADAVVTPLTTLTGVADATTLTAAANAWLDFIA